MCVFYGWVWGLASRRATEALQPSYNNVMAKKHPAAARYVQPYRFPSPNVPLSAIRQFADQIVERFHPEKIILFGSYGEGLV